MNMKPDDELIARWVADDLEGEELAKVEAYASEHPELFQDKIEQGQISDLLQREIPSEEPIPYPDFFNTQVMRHIELEQGEANAAPKRKSSRGFRRWFVPVALAGMAACFYMGMIISPVQQESGDGLMAHVYTPDEKVSAEVVGGSDSEPMIIILNGLDDIPDSIEMAQSSGLSGASYVSYEKEADDSTPVLVTF